MRAEKPVFPSSPPAGFGERVPLLSGPVHSGRRLPDLPPAAPAFELRGPTLCLRLPNPGLLFPEGVLKLCVKKLGKPDGFCF